MAATGRRLSNIEWITFLNEVDPERLNFPQWGGLVEWGGLQILCFRGANGEWFLSDVSNVPEIATYPKTRDPWGKVFIANIPKELATVTAERAKQAGTAVVWAAGVLGNVAGGATGPLLRSLTIPLIVVGIVGLVVLMHEV